MSPAVVSGIKRFFRGLAAAVIGAALTYLITSGGDFVTDASIWALISAGLLALEKFLRSIKFLPEFL